ncbi:MAG TPA: FAD-dependent oxidoreductase [Chitinophagales bacterium]
MQHSFRAFLWTALLCPAIVFSQNKKIKVAIVGGGMAGVSAAHSILSSDPDASITIFEKESVMGGNAKSITVKNSRSEDVVVDAGPQYFTEGPWDEYIQFLKTYNVYNTSETSEFTGSIRIDSKGKARPRLITPLKGSFRGESLGKLIQFKRFFDESFYVFQNPKSVYPTHIEDWVNSLSFDTTFKEQIIFPFLAASLGTDISSIKKTATCEIIRLFAFRKPSSKNSFKVMHKGMGTLIQQIGSALQVKGVRIQTNATVKQIAHTNENYILTYQNGNETQQETFDFVVLAVHADQAYKLLKSDSYFDTISSSLKELRYFQARIVLHHDSTLVNTSRPAFLNITTSADNQIIANTMNLGMIDERYKGIYKSWLTKELCDKVKANGTFLHEEVFYHPLITPEFNISLVKLKDAVSKVAGLSLCGGWTQGLETQETAVHSGVVTLEKYRKFKSLLL